MDRDTDLLLPLSVQDWLSKGHLARDVVEAVEGLDLSVLVQAYGGTGSTPYHPAMLLALLIDGYATGRFSSRKIERATYDSLAFRFMACNFHPDHDTLATFRRRFRKECEAAFVQVLEVARENQFSRFGSVCLDGAKIHANASRHSALSYGHAEALEAHLRAEVQALLALAKRTDGAKRLAADAGYFSTDNVAACDAAGIEPLIAVTRDQHHPHWSEQFREPPELAPAATPVERMTNRLKTGAGRAAHALRKQTVEPVFWIIKSVMGFRQFLTRGLDNVQGEWTLVCLAWNLKRMAVLRLQSGEHRGKLCF